MKTIESRIHESSDLEDNGNSGDAHGADERLALDALRSARLLSVSDSRRAIARKRLENLIAAEPRARQEAAWRLPSLAAPWKRLAMAGAAVCIVLSISTSGLVAASGPESPLYDARLMLQSTFANSGTGLPEAEQRAEELALMAGRAVPDSAIVRASERYQRALQQAALAKAGEPANLALRASLARQRTRLQTVEPVGLAARNAVQAALGTLGEPPNSPEPEQSRNMAGLDQPDIAAAHQATPARECAGDCLTPASGGTPVVRGTETSDQVRLRERDRDTLRLTPMVTASTKPMATPSATATTTLATSTPVRQQQQTQATLTPVVRAGDAAQDQVQEQEQVRDREQIQATATRHPSATAAPQATSSGGGFVANPTSVPPAPAGPTAGPGTGAGPVAPQAPQATPVQTQPNPTAVGGNGPNR